MAGCVWEGVDACWVEQHRTRERERERRGSSSSVDQLSVWVSQELLLRLSLRNAIDGSEWSLSLRIGQCRPSSEKGFRVLPRWRRQTTTQSQVQLRLHSIGLPLFPEWKKEPANDFRVYTDFPKNGIVSLLHSIPACAQQTWSPPTVFVRSLWFSEVGLVERTGKPLNMRFCERRAVSSSVLRCQRNSLRPAKSTSPGRSSNAPDLRDAPCSFVAKIKASSAFFVVCKNDRPCRLSLSLSQSQKSKPPSFVANWFYHLKSGQITSWSIIRLLHIDWHCSCQLSLDAGSRSKIKLGFDQQE